MIDLARKDRQMLLEYVNLFGAIKLTQAEKLLKLKFPYVDVDMTVKPLLSGRKIRQSGEYLFSKSGKIEDKLIEAIDIMLLLGPDISQPIMKGSLPFILTFFKSRENKLWRYDICPVGYGTEAVVSAMLENVSTKYRMLVFLPEKEDQVKALRIPCEHCYVLENNGEYKFYISKKEEK